MGDERDKSKKEWLRGQRGWNTLENKEAREEKGLES
jgi:hypothetical protein